MLFLYILPLVVIIVTYGGIVFHLHRRGVTTSPGGVARELSACGRRLAVWQALSKWFKRSRGKRLALKGRSGWCVVEPQCRLARVLNIRILPQQHTLMIAEVCPGSFPCGKVSYCLFSCFLPGP